MTSVIFKTLLAVAVMSSMVACGQKKDDKPPLSKLDKVKPQTPEEKAAADKAAADKAAADKAAADKVAAEKALADKAAAEKTAKEAEAKKKEAADADSKKSGRNLKVESNSPGQKKSESSGSGSSGSKSGSSTGSSSGNATTTNDNGSAVDSAGNTEKFNAETQEALFKEKNYNMLRDASRYASIANDKLKEAVKSLREAVPTKQRYYDLQAARRITGVTLDRASKNDQCRVTVLVASSETKKVIEYLGRCSGGGWKEKQPTSGRSVAKINFQCMDASSADSVADTSDAASGQTCENFLMSVQAPTDKNNQVDYVNLHFILRDINFKITDAKFPEYSKAQRSAEYGALGDIFQASSPDGKASFQNAFHVSKLRMRSTEVVDGLTSAELVIDFNDSNTIFMSGEFLKVGSEDAQGQKIPPVALKKSARNSAIVGRKVDIQNAIEKYEMISNDNSGNFKIGLTFKSRSVDGNAESAVFDITAKPKQVNIDTLNAAPQESVK